MSSKQSGSVAAREKYANSQLAKWRKQSTPVWGKLGGFPYWPCRVLTEAEEENFAKKAKKPNPKSGTIVGVIFLGIRKDKGWIQAKDIDEFKPDKCGNDNIYLSFNKVKKPSEMDYRVAIREAIRVGEFVGQYTFPQQLLVELAKFEVNSKEEPINLDPEHTCIECGGTDRSGALVWCETCGEKCLHTHCVADVMPFVESIWYCNDCCGAQNMKTNRMYPRYITDAPEKGQVTSESKNSKDGSTSGKGKGKGKGKSVKDDDGSDEESGGKKGAKGSSRNAKQENQLAFPMNGFPFPFMPGMMQPLNSQSSGSGKSSKSKSKGSSNQNDFNNMIPPIMNMYGMMQMANGMLLPNGMPNMNAMQSMFQGNAGSSHNNKHSISDQMDNGSDSDNEEEMSNADSDAVSSIDYCFVCGDGGTLILCDFPGCARAYHQTCVLPTFPTSLDSHPANADLDDPWYCPAHTCALCDVLEETTLSLQYQSLPKHYALKINEEASRRGVTSISNTKDIIPQARLTQCESCPFSVCTRCEKDYNTSKGIEKDPLQQIDETGHFSSSNTNVLQNALFKITTKESLPWYLTSQNKLPQDEDNGSFSNRLRDHDRCHLSTGGTCYRYCHNCYSNNPIMNLAKILELAWSRMACSRSATPFFKILSVYSDELDHDDGNDDLNREAELEAVKKASGHITAHMSTKSSGHTDLNSAGKRGRQGACSPQRGGGNTLSPRSPGALLAEQAKATIVPVPLLDILVKIRSLQYMKQSEFLSDVLSIKLALEGPPSNGQLTTTDGNEASQDSMVTVGDESTVNINPLYADIDSNDREILLTAIGNISRLCQTALREKKHMIVKYENEIEGYLARERRSVRSGPGDSSPENDNAGPDRKRVRGDGKDDKEKSSRSPTRSKEKDSSSSSNLSSLIMPEIDFSNKGTNSGSGGTTPNTTPHLSFALAKAMEPLWRKECFRLLPVYKTIADAFPKNRTITAWCNFLQGRSGTSGIHLAGIDKRNESEALMKNVMSSVVRDSTSLPNASNGYGGIHSDASLIETVDDFDLLGVNRGSGSVPMGGNGLTDLDTGDPSYWTRDDNQGLLSLQQQRQDYDYRSIDAAEVMYGLKSSNRGETVTLMEDTSRFEQWDPTPRINDLLATDETLVTLDRLKEMTRKTLHLEARLRKEYLDAKKFQQETAIEKITLGELPIIHELKLANDNLRWRVATKNRALQASNNTIEALKKTIAAKDAHIEKLSGQ